MSTENDVRVCQIEDGDVRVSILNLGAITQGWWVPCGGKSVPVVLGYEDPATYRRDTNYLGAIVGRVANRTAGGSFELDGKRYQVTQNEGDNQLHGGHQGLHRRIWAMEPDSSGKRVELTLNLPDGDEGYPGSVDFRVEISLMGSRVTYELEATVGRPTPINLAQHNYYNLVGEGTILNHHLTLAADSYTPVNDAKIPTGTLEPVDGTFLDFRGGATFAQKDQNGLGIDHNLVVSPTKGELPIAVARAENGLELRMWTDQPGLQVYTGDALVGAAPGHNRQPIGACSGFCLEPQGFPNALNTASFPSIIVRPEQPYRQRTVVEISERLS